MDTPDNPSKKPFKSVGSHLKYGGLTLENWDPDPDVIRAALEQMDEQDRLDALKKAQEQDKKPD